jgi:hypothetical protein
MNSLYRYDFQVEILQKKFSERNTVRNDNEVEEVKFSKK